MDVFTRYGLAWVTVFLGVVLICKALTRVISQKYKRLTRLNRILKKVHIPAGLLMIVTAFIHGLHSAEDIWSINLGTLAWAASILLFLNYITRNKLGRKGVWMYHHRSFAFIFVCLAVLHVVDVGGIRIFSVISSRNAVVDNENEETGPNNANEENGSQETGPDNADEENGSQETVLDNADPEDGPVIDHDNTFHGVVLKDGVYTGRASGYQAGLTVSVTVEEGLVTEIEITSHREVNERYYGRPMREVPADIIESQNLDVDTVSGATCTSVGIINAVNTALKKAVVSGELPPQRKWPGR